MSIVVDPSLNTEERRIKYIYLPLSLGPLFFDVPTFMHRERAAIFEASVPPPAHRQRQPQVNGPGRPD